MQLEKLKSKKMGFDLAKHGLNLKMGFKTKFGLIFGEAKKRRREEKGRRRRGGKGRGREEEDEGEKFKQGQKGMELCIDLYGYMFVGCGL